MKFAVCNELFGDWPWEQGLKLAHDVGYRGVEVAPFTLGSYADQIDQGLRERYRKFVQDHGMEVIGLHWLLAKTEGFHLTTADRQVRSRTAKYLRELVQLCSDLGGEVMVLGSPQQRNLEEGMTHEQAMENAAEVLKEVKSALEDHQVSIAIEPLGPQEGNFLNHAYQARTLIEMVQSPQVRLHLDVKAMSTEGEPIEDVIRQNADWMIHFHANDPNLLGPGMGEVDQRPIFQALTEIGYTGWVSVEVFDYAPGVETILRESWNGMQRALGAG